MKLEGFTLSKRIFVVLVILVFTCVFFVSAVSDLLNRENANHIREISEQNATILTNKINQNIQTLETLANFIGTLDCITCENVNSVIKYTTNGKEFEISVLLPDGSNIYDITENVTFKSYFKLAMSGVTNISEIIWSVNNNENKIVYAIPIIKDSGIIGVLRATYPVYELCEILNIHPMNKNGYIVIIEKSGNVILHSKDTESSLPYRNIYRYIRSFNGNDEKLKNFYNNIQDGESNSVVFNKGNELKYISYIPLEEIKDWYLLTIEPYNVLSKDAFSVVIYFIIVFIILILLSIVVIIYIYNNKKIIEQLAFHDRLTGGNNLNKFIVEAKNILAKNKAERYCIVKLDIDKFKYYNDIHGYEIGSEILKYVYNVLSSMLAKDEIVARDNGDNFILLLKYENKDSIAQRLGSLYSKPINLSEFSSELSAKYILEMSFGVYCILESDIDVNSIVDKANMAQKQAKGNRYERIAFYDDSLRSTIIKEKELENIMYSSLVNNEFVVYLQPKYNINTNKVVGAEALIRWNHPEKGLLYPGSFISLFEKNGFIVNIDMFMLESVCKIISNWINQGYKPVPISLNISIISFNSENFVNKLKTTISKYNVPFNLIEIELVETMVCDNVQKFLYIINRLKEVGISISMDDFGTGYSSLNLLKDMPIDVIKLDRGFFDESTYTNKGEAIVASIIKLAEDLEITTICEGIETNRQLEFVKKVGCFIVQGYLLSKPITVENFETIAFLDHI